MADQVVYEQSFTQLNQSTPFVEKQKFISPIQITAFTPIHLCFRPHN